MISMHKLHDRHDFYIIIKQYIKNVYDMFLCKIYMTCMIFCKVVPMCTFFMQKLHDMHDFYATVGLAGCRISSECRGGVET